MGRQLSGEAYCMVSVIAAMVLIVAYVNHLKWIERLITNEQRLQRLGRYSLQGWPDYRIYDIHGTFG